MSSLVEELQRDALDSRINVSDLLRKAYVVASKLKLDQFKSWCASELTGYKDEQVPPYRLLGGILRAKRFGRWNALQLFGPQLDAELSTNPIVQPIGEVEALIASSGPAGILLYFDSEMRYALSQGGAFPYEIAVHVGLSQVCAIVDAVRNAILDWSLHLEDDGILGDGISFSAEEKQRAELKADELQSIVNNFYFSNIENSALQLATSKSEQRHGA